MAEGKTLSVERREDGVAIIWMDVPGEPVNTLKKGFAEEFQEVFEEVERDAGVKAIVFASKKKDNFLAGADISMVQETRTADGGRIGQYPSFRLDVLPNRRRDWTEVTIYPRGKQETTTQWITMDADHVLPVEECI